MTFCFSTFVCFIDLIILFSLAHFTRENEILVIPIVLAANAQHRLTDVTRRGCGFRKMTGN